MNSSSSVGRGRQRGSALLVTLLIFAIGIALVVPMYREYTLFLKRTANSFTAEQSNAYLRGGEELAALVLIQDRLLDREEGAERDDLSEVWSRESQAYPLDEGGWLQGKLEDLQGRFHLNSLDTTPAQGQRFSAAQEQFIRLLQTFSELEVSQQDAMLITTAVLDWMDGDTEPRDLGAEDLYYFSATPPYRAANRRFASVSELRAVANMSPDLYLALEPFLSVWPDTGERLKLNVNTAPAQVLRSLNSPGDYQPLSEVEGEMLLELRGRGENGFESMEAFLNSPPMAERKLAEELRQNLGLGSDYFLFSGETDIAGRITRLYSVLHRGQQVRALVRSSGSL